MSAQLKYNCSDPFSVFDQLRNHCSAPLDADQCSQNLKFDRNQNALYLIIIKNLMRVSPNEIHVNALSISYVAIKDCNSGTSCSEMF